MTLLKHTNYRSSPTANTPIVKTWVGWKTHGKYRTYRWFWHEWEYYLGG